MEAINFGKNYTQSQPAELQRRLESQENFTALDTEKLKQDTVELTNKAKENASENFIFKTLRNFGVDDPKKFLKSLAMSIGTVIAVAILGNKLTNPARKFGHRIDKFLTGDNVIGKCRNAVVGLLNKSKNSISKLPKPKVIQNAQKALREHHASPKLTIFRGYENGAKGLFSNTIVETLNGALEKSQEKTKEALEKLLGSNSKVEELLYNLKKHGKSKICR